jgi:signal transduction histidine kinase
MEPDFRTLFEQTPGLYCVLSPDFRVVAMTDAYARATLRDRQGLLGRTLLELFPATLGDPGSDGVNNLRDSLEFVRREKTPHQMAVLRHDVARTDAEGSGSEERYWSLRNSPVLDQGGELRYIIHAAQEVTAMVRLERQEADEHQQLLTSNTALAASNQELEAFCYSVAHDLRAPLRGIQGFSQALLEDYSAAVDAKGQGYLQRVASAALRMSELIDDLLTLSRISRGPLLRGPVDLSAMARGVAAELARRHDRQIRVTIGDRLTAHADPRLMQIALENLLANAWKFTAHAADPHVEFAVEADPESSAGRAFVVRDNGAGFDEANASNLFAPFQRLHSEKEFAGTGIGLATVQRIVRRHGGRVWAHAAPNRGAAFYFTLPD